MKAKPSSKDFWEGRFETLLEDDGYAQTIFGRLLRNDVPQRRLVLLLQAVADPNIGSRLQRLIEDGEATSKRRNVGRFLFPTKQKAQHLANKLRDAATEIRGFWLHSYFAALPYSKTAVVTAELLDEQAKALDEVRWNVITTRFGYKGFWKQSPLVPLCLELKVPVNISYVDLSQLLLVALRAHYCPDDDRSVQRKLWPILDSLKIPRAGFHAFRHAASTLLIDSGASPATVQAQLGHSDPRITLSAYSHTVDKSQRKAVERLAKILIPNDAKTVVTTNAGKWIQ